MCGSRIVLVHHKTPSTMRVMSTTILNLVKSWTGFCWSAFVRDWLSRYGSVSVQVLYNEGKAQNRNLYTTAYQISMHFFCVHLACCISTLLSWLATLHDVKWSLSWSLILILLNFIVMLTLTKLVFLVQLVQIAFQVISYHTNHVMPTTMSAIKYFIYSPLEIR